MNSFQELTHELKSKNNKLQDDLVSKNNECHDLTNTMNILQEELECKVTEKSQLHTDKRMIDSSLTRLKEENHSQANEIKCLKEQLEAHSETVDNLERMYQEEKSYVIDQKNVIVDLNKQIDNVERRCEMNLKISENLKGDNYSLSEKLKCIRNELEHKNNMLDENGNMMHDLKESNSQLRNEVLEVTTILEVEKANNEQISKKLAERTELVRELENKLNSEVQVIDTLRCTSENYNNDNRLLMFDLDDMKKSIQGLKDHKVTLEYEIKVLGIEVESEKKLNYSLVSDKEALYKELAQVKIDLEDQRNRNQEVNNEKINLQYDYKMLNNECEQERRTSDELRNNIHCMNQDIKDYKNEIENEKDKLIE